MQSYAPFYGIALSQLLFVLLQGSTAWHTAKEGLLAAGILFLCAMPLLWLLCKAGKCPRLQAVAPVTGRIVAVLLFASGFAQLFRIVAVCHREYRTSGVWVLLLTIGLLSLPLHWQALCRMSQALWGFAILAALILVGLLDHLSWKNLSFAPVELSRVNQACMALWVCCPEFLALPWVSKRPTKLWWKLPAMLLAVQSIEAVLAEALFGWQLETGRFSSLEAVRCCGIGAFSRLDDVFVGLWLLLALYRLAVLGQLIRMVWPGGGYDESADA